MQLKSIIDLIDDEEEKNKGITSIIDSIPKEEIKPKQPIKNITPITDLMQGMGFEKPTQPKQPLQDMAQIMPESVEAPAEPAMGTAGYIGGKVYSTLFEKPISAMAEPISWVLEKGFRLVGLNNLADQQKEVTELYKNPPVTKKVQEQTAYLRQEAYKKGTFQGVGFDLTESVTQLMGLLTQIAATKKIPSLSGLDIIDTFKVMGGHAV